MPDKNVFLFDDSNIPLNVAGIEIRLLDSKTGALIDKQLSKKRVSTSAGIADWGADLSFSASSNPLDLYITDTTYEYPGNTIQFLNGQTTDRIDLDLRKIPTGTLTNPPPSNSTPADIVSAVLAETNWTLDDKRTVINLLTNYVDIIYKETAFSPELGPDIQEIITNWDNALKRLGIDGIELGIQVLENEKW